jgi:hypothetical protein
MCAGAPNDVLAQVFGLPEPPCYAPAAMPKATPLHPARAQTLPPSEGFSADSGLNFADDTMENDVSEFVGDRTGNEHGSSNSTPGEEKGDPPSGESSVKGLLEDVESTSSKAAEGALGGGGNCSLDLEWMQGSTPRGDDFEWEGVLERLPAFDLPGEWAADFSKGAAEEKSELQGGEVMPCRREMGAVQIDGGSGIEVAQVGGEHFREEAWLGGAGAEWGDGLEQMFSRRVANERQVGAQERGTADISAKSGVSREGYPDSGQRPMFEQLDTDPSRVSRFRLPDAPFPSTKRKAQTGGFAHAPVASATTPLEGGILSPIELLTRGERFERGAPMEIEQAQVQHPPTAELSNPGIARQLAPEEGRHLARAHGLQRTRSDPAQWLQSYNSGEGLLGDAIAPLPPPRAPRLSRLQRQNSLPHFPGGPPRGGRLQRQRSAPEPEVTRLLAEQILLEMQQNEEGGGEQTLNLDHLLFDQHRSLTEIPTPGAWGGDPSEGCQPWLGVPPQRLKAEKRAKFQQQREIEARWQEHAQQRAAAQTLSGVPPSLAGIARPARRGGAHRGERRRAPLLESFPAAHQPSSFGQSQVQIAHQAVRNQLDGPSEIPPWLPAESLLPVAPASFPELGPELPFQPAFGKPPSSHQTYERIVIPDLPGGSAPNAMSPSMPNQSFVVPVGPHLARVMRIFQSAQHTGVATQHERPTGPPVKAPAQPVDFSPRTQLPDWQMLAFENVPLELEFADSPGADTNWFPS